MTKSGSVVERDARPPIFLPFYSFTFLLLTSFFTFLLFYSFTFKSESSFHHNQVFFSSQLSLLFVTIKSSFLKEDAYFSDYECTSRSTPEIHHENYVDTHGVICDFFKKGVLMYFLREKLFSVIVYEGFFDIPSMSKGYISEEFQTI